MSSAQEQLQNLQKIGKLKAEPPNQAEFDGLVRSAKRKAGHTCTSRSSQNATVKRFLWIPPAPVSRASQVN